jgi:hypothetical protein
MQAAMWNHYIGKQIGRCNRNLLLVNGLLVVVLLALALLSRRYWYNFFLGPFPLDHKALLEIKDPGQLHRYFVTVKTDRPPVRLNGGGQGGSFDVDGFIFIRDDFEQKPRLLLVRGEIPSTANPDRPTAKSGSADAAQVGGRPSSTARLSGCLVDVPDHLIKNVLNPLEARHPSLRGVPIRTVQLDMTGFRGPGYCALALGVPLFLLGCWNLKRGWARFWRPEQHPLVADLARLGPPAQVASSIEREVKRDAPRLPLASRVVTRSWLLKPTPFGLEVTPLAGAV